MGKDNEGTEMVPMIVHVMCYVISKEQKKKWGRNRHACNVQGSPSVTCAMPFAYTKIYPRLIIQGRMDNQNAQINGWNNTSGSTVMKDKTIGTNGYQWQNLRRIPGLMRQQRSPVLISSWGIHRPWNGLVNQAQFHQ